MGVGRARRPYRIVLMSNVSIHEYSRVLAAFVEGALQGRLESGPTDTQEVTRRPNADSTYVAQDPHLRGQYH